MFYHPMIAKLSTWGKDARYGARHHQPTGSYDRFQHLKGIQDNIHSLPP